MGCGLPLGACWSYLRFIRTGAPCLPRQPVRRNALLDPRSVSSSLRSSNRKSGVRSCLSGFAAELSCASVILKPTPISSPLSGTPPTRDPVRAGVWVRIENGAHPRPGPSAPSGTRSRSPARLLSEQCFRKRVVSAVGFAHHHRDDRRLTQPRPETFAVERGFPVARVGPQMLDAFRFVLEHIERRQTSGCHRGRMRGREQKRPRAVVQIIDQIARPADVSAQDADGFR